MSKRILILIFLITFVPSETADSSNCFSKNKHDCLEPNKMLMGKDYLQYMECCWNTDLQTCVSAPDVENVPFYIWRNKMHLDCGTTADVCEALDKVGSRDRDRCNFNMPFKDYEDTDYKCCYVGDGKYNRCMMVDYKHKTTFKKIMYYMRAINEDYDGDYRIDCARATYFYKKTVLFVAFFVFAFLL